LICCFLLSSGCDINSPRQSGFNGETPDICKTLETPLHLGRFSCSSKIYVYSRSLCFSACQWGLERVVSSLIEYHADINKKDNEGNTPVHIAIINQHLNIINLLIRAPKIDLSIRNKQNQTAFACSIVSKNNEAANLILKREPKAADQVNSHSLFNKQTNKQTFIFNF